MRENHHREPNARPVELSTVLSAFQRLTGLCVVARAAAGAPVEHGGHGEPRFCRLVHEAGCGASQWRVALAGAAPPTGDLAPRVFECCPGLSEGVIRLPVPLGEAEVVTCGPVLDAGAHSHAPDEVIRRAAASGADPDILRDALVELPVMSRAGLESAMDLLAALLRWHAVAGEADPAKFRHARQESASSPLDDLLAALRGGDRQAASQRARAALDAACPRGAEAGTHIRERALRLAMALTDAATEGGVPSETAEDAILRAASIIPAATDAESIRAVLREALAALLQTPSSEEPWAAHVARRAAAYIETHYRRPLMLDDVAQHVHLSPSYFSGLFKRERGVGFRRFLQEVRIAQAQRLLDGSSSTVEEVASAVGFEDVHYFSRVFTQSVGVPPGQFRRRRRWGAPFPDA